MKKKLTSSLLAGSILFSSLAFSPVVSADSYDEEIQTLEQQISEIEAEESAAAQELESLQNAIEANEERIAELNETLEGAQEEMKVLEEEISGLEDNIAQRNEKLKEQARTIQVDGNAANMIEFVINSDSITDAFGRIDLVTDLVNANASLVEEQQADKAAVEEKKVATEEAIQKQMNSIAELEATTRDLDGQELAKEVLIIDLALEKTETQGERDNLVSLKEQAEAQAVAYAEQQEEISRSVASALETNNEELDSTVSLAATEAVDTATTEEATEATDEPAASSDADTSSQESSSSASNSNSSASTSHSSASSSNSRQASNAGPNTNQPAPAATPTSSPEPASKPKPKPEPKPAAAPASKSNGSVLGIASQYLGVPYLWAGTTPSGFDCSGFTQYVFAQAGISIGRNTNAQYAQATPVSNPQPGDLVFFSSGGGGITHVGIYTGGGQFIGSQSSTGVAYTSVHSGYWGPLFVGYGRI